MIISAIVILNLLSAKDSIGTKSTKRKDQLPPKVDVKKYVNQPEEPGLPRPRICPLCGTVLSHEDYLVAAISEQIEGLKRQAHIYGCPYCFETDGVNLNAGAKNNEHSELKKPDRELTKMEP